MEYISKDINYLVESLHDKVVEFEYKKSNGVVRHAKGTLIRQIIGDEYDEVIKLEINVVNDMVHLKGYGSVDEYAKENRVKWTGMDSKYYYFEPIKKERKPDVNVQIYYDLDSQDFRSFKKENFLGVIKA